MSFTPLQCLVDAIMLAWVLDHSVQAVFKVIHVSCNSGFTLSVPSAITPFSVTYMLFVTQDTLSSQAFIQKSSHTCVTTTHTPYVYHV